MCWRRTFTILVWFLTGKDQWRQPDGGRRQFYCWDLLCLAPMGDPTRRDSGRRPIDQLWDSDTRYWLPSFQFSCHNKRTLFSFQIWTQLQWHSTFLRWLSHHCCFLATCWNILGESLSLCGECLFKDCIRLAWGKDEVELWVKGGRSHISLVKRNLGLS